MPSLRLLLFRRALPPRAAIQTSAWAAEPIAARTADVQGVKLHYLTSGHGAPLLLLHGYAETSRCADSEPSPGGAIYRHRSGSAGDRRFSDTGGRTGYESGGCPHLRTDVLARFQEAEVVGHDIGLMVAYAYAAMYPAETTKLVVMDAFLPGVAGWEALQQPGIWHFRFNGPTPEALVRGRERIYFDYFWNDFAADKTRSIPEADRKAYASAYARPGRMKAGWAYFVSFNQAAKDFAELARTPLTMPVLAIGGEKSLARFSARR